ncbi:C-type mannose receptor 2-like [Misgurnus anguillicaudatus]|uniref:C-type mannose receptor 2-like n=1 Tax=Misgurnus anguillicaudatus TaxID=75329 RepID=UPI003CCFC5A5
MEKLGLLTFLLLLLYTSAANNGSELLKQIVFVENTLSWYDASYYCKTYYDDLFSVSDLNDLRNLIDSGKPLSWIGLFRWSSFWIWIDHTTPVFFNWNFHENCATISRFGVWHNVSCDSLYPSVCQDAQMGLHYNGTPDTWFNAKKACEDHQYNFPIIRNYWDNKNFTDAIHIDPAWIGLSKDTNLPNTWRWVNNESLTYSSWFTPLFCAVLDQSGIWYDRACFEENPFVCFSENNQIRTYTLVEERKNFSEAQSHCKVLSMNLITVKTQEENTALLYYISQNGGFSGDNVHFWIGLYNNPWYWVSGHSNIQNWNRNQPDNISQNQPIESEAMSCVASEDGEWSDEDCLIHLPFFCSITVPSPILVSEPKSWEDALDYCRGRYVDLISLISDVEQQLAVRNIQGVQNSYVWTGLRFLAGSWFWVHGDKLKYENWLDDGQKQCPGNLRCGALAAASGKWEPRSCEDKLSFLCF